MSSPFWRLSVESSFSAGHALRNYQGKCENMHGHNFAVVVEVEGSKLTSDTELLLDFKELKGMLREVLGKLDHRDLNVTAPFENSNPSSENLSRYIYQELAALLATYPVRLHSVKVAEKPGQSATYFG